VPEIEDTPPPSPHELPVEDTLQEVPEEGQQEEEDAVEDAPSVGTAAMATEVLRVLGGSGSHSAKKSYVSPPLHRRDSTSAHPLLRRPSLFLMS
jgi:hypothetical protein